MMNEWMQTHNKEFFKRQHELVQGWEAGFPGVMINDE